MADGLYCGASGSVMRSGRWRAALGPGQVVLSADQQAVDHAFDAGRGERGAAGERRARRGSGTQPRSSTTPRPTARASMVSPARRGSARKGCVHGPRGRRGREPGGGGFPRAGGRRPRTRVELTPPIHSLRANPATSPAPRPSAAPENDLCPAQPIVAPHAVSSYMEISECG